MFLLNLQNILLHIQGEKMKDERIQKKKTKKNN